VTAKDVEVSVRFRPVAGSVDQAGGLIVRAQDNLNYYVRSRQRARRQCASVYGGERRTAADRRQKTSPSPAVFGIPSRSGSRAIAWKLSMTANPSSRSATGVFTGPGRVGLWTKADSLTYFTDLKIAPFASDN